MRRWKLFIGVIAVVVVVIGWYFFRPELLFIDRAVNEQFPAGAASGRATILAKGRFRGLAHETRGAATIYQLPDGSRTLRLTDFETSNGPDVRVYLVAAPDAKDNDTVRSAGFIDLGAMKGNKGDQNYEVSAGADLGKYRSVSIWCRRFSVNFGAAPLSGANP